MVNLCQLLVVSPPTRQTLFPIASRLLSVSICVHLWMPLTLRGYCFAHAGKFAPDVLEAFVAVFVAVDVAQSRDGGVAYVG